MQAIQQENKHRVPLA